MWKKHFKFLTGQTFVTLKIKIQSNTGLHIELTQNVGKPWSYSYPFHDVG